MSALPPPLPEPPAAAAQVDGEQRFVIHDVPWSAYVAFRDAVDQPGLRMTYCEGTLELTCPSGTHEDKKSLIGRLLEMYSVECRIPLHAMGSTTYRKEAEARGLEPDECYFALPRRGSYPDIAIEVVIASGGIDKLEIYRGLGVREAGHLRPSRRPIRGGVRLPRRAPR